MALTRSQQMNPFKVLSAVRPAAQPAAAQDAAAQDAARSRAAAQDAAAELAIVKSELAIVKSNLAAQQLAYAQPAAQQLTAAQYAHLAAAHHAKLAAAELAAAQPQATVSLGWWIFLLITYMGFLYLTSSSKDCWIDFLVWPYSRPTFSWIRNGLFGLVLTFVSIILDKICCMHAGSLVGPVAMALNLLYLLALSHWTSFDISMVSLFVSSFVIILVAAIAYFGYDNARVVKGCVMLVTLVFVLLGFFAMHRVAANQRSLLQRAHTCLALPAGMQYYNPSDMEKFSLSEFQHGLHVLESPSTSDALERIRFLMISRADFQDTEVLLEYARHSVHVCCVLNYLMESSDYMHFMYGSWY
jgi:hypothetical protein